MVVSVLSEQEAEVIAVGKLAIEPMLIPSDEAVPVAGAKRSSRSSHFTYLVDPSMVMAVPSAMEKAGNQRVVLVQLTSRLL